MYRMSIKIKKCQQSQPLSKTGVTSIPLIRFTSGNMQQKEQTELNLTCWSQVLLNSMYNLLEDR